MVTIHMVTIWLMDGYYMVNGWLTNGFIHGLWDNDGIILGYWWIYPLVMTVTVCYWTWPIEIVDLPWFTEIKHIDFPVRYVNVYQRVYDMYTCIYIYCIYIYTHCIYIIYKFNILVPYQDIPFICACGRNSGEMLFVGSICTNLTSLCTTVPKPF